MTEQGHRQVPEAPEMDVAAAILAAPVEEPAAARAVVKDLVSK